ncbi:uncharacterized protein LOC144881613 [Branchiostoma floridae x Branchiostoma japonicum]
MAFYMGNGSTVGTSTSLSSELQETTPWANFSVDFVTLPTTVLYLSDLPETTSQPCLHGRCLDGDYKTTCATGRTGPNCQQDWCAEKPCQHGSCENKGGGYNCTCSPGWTGRNCQQGMNWCFRNPCQHGGCENRVGGYKCICSPGWTGKNCQEARKCQPGWKEYNNHCYKLMTESVSGDSANQKCRGMGANLASVRDSQENTFIANTIKGAEGDMVWIGLNNRKEGFEWTDGSSCSYTNWAEGQPDNNWWKGGEGCVIMYNKV